MSKKKKNKRNQRHHVSPVRLTVYVIAKNEERNIAKALSWAKDLAYEQIVVDTGSTDRTAEIAESMGAKVFHFNWINNFSAARNYAIEQSTGNWIGGIDADEYFEAEDAKIYFDFLKKIQLDKVSGERCQAVSCTAINLDDEGRPTSRVNRICAFRNNPSIRYFGNIHERLNLDEDRIVYANGFKSYHTGYSETAIKETGKMERNIGLLRAELEKKPGDLNIKAYLADSLSSSCDEKYRIEAENLYTDVLNGHKEVYDVLKLKAYIFFIRKYLDSPDTLQKCEEMCLKALSEFPGTLDIEYYLGYTLNNKGEHHKAWELLKKCEAKLPNVSATNDKSYLVPENPVVLYGQIMIAAHGLGDVENVVMYSTLILTIDKTRQEVLSSCIATLLRCGASDSDLTELLSQLYDLNKHDELMFIVQAANDCGANAFADRLVRGEISLL